MESAVIPEPHRTYLLELLQALGPAAEDFVLAGAQAMRFFLAEARPTRDFDFILDAFALRASTTDLGATLHAIGYEVVPESRNFQFLKPIPGSREVMRIEFMAPPELAPRKDFRVAIQAGVHGHSLRGASVALRESTAFQINGTLPDRTLHSQMLRVARPHALAMLKILAIADRERNLRGSRHAAHDRNEAGIHAADVAAILRAQNDLASFSRSFTNQLSGDDHLREDVMSEIVRLFATDTSPGILLYEEQLRGRDIDQESLERELQLTVTRFAVLVGG